MSIQTIHGQDFYNYEIRNTDIIDYPNYNENEGITTKQSSKQDQSYQLHLRNRKKYGKCKKFRRFLYNTETRTSCNRTGHHWGAMIFYYAFFLGMMLVLFMCYFYGIHRTIVPSNEATPPITKFYNSEIPTFTFVPVSVNPYPMPLLWYELNGNGSDKHHKIDVYVKAIRKFYKEQATSCAKMKITDGCKVHPSLYGPCGEDKFGYNQQKPCLFLKLNVKSGFIPDAFHSKHRLPQSMPKELVDNIDLNRETLCIHCSGESNHDRNHLGVIKYYPEVCYNDSYFPSSDKHVDVNPTIAIQLNPDPGYLLELTCKLFGVKADGTGEYRQSMYIFIGQK